MILAEGGEGEGGGSGVFTQQKDLLLVVDVFMHPVRCVPSFCGAQSSLRLHLVQWKLASWTIDLIMPSYGKSEICRSSLSGPMSVSVLLGSIHSAHHSNNNNI
jgi:hypothetical protein